MVNRPIKRANSPDLLQTAAMRAFENLRWLRLAVVLALTMFHVPISRAQGTALTYQGQLMNNGQIANGNYDFTFTLLATNQGGSAVASVVTNLNTSVSGGLFLATLDFGDVFNGSNYWLEIAVRPAGNGSFTTLAPRQIINPVPYALFSANASNAAAVPASGIVGTIPSANLPTNLTSSAGTVWQSPSSTTVQAHSNTGYVVTNSQQVTITLPAAPNIGDIVKISGAGTGGWVVAQNAGQTIAASFTPLVLPGDASGTWQSIASSSDGTKLAAVDNAGDGIWTSRNSGASWTQTTAPTVPNWYSIASSADGTRLAAVDNGGGIWISSNSGGSWAETIASTNSAWTCIASSTNGMKLAAAVSGGAVWISTNFGTNWRQATAPSATVQSVISSSDWTCIASSADGTKLAAGTDDGPVWTFLNGVVSQQSASSSGATIVGTSGFLEGAFGSTVELIYAGGGQFVALCQTGSFSGH
jgi:hypothetical protein